jgi:F-type H+-transporting ATPase subunit b
MDVNFIHIRV